MTEIGRRAGSRRCSTAAVVKAMAHIRGVDFSFIFALTFAAMASPVGGAGSTTLFPNAAHPGWTLQDAVTNTPAGGVVVIVRPIGPISSGLTITKALTIQNAGVKPAVGNITINAGANDHVTLRGLNLISYGSTPVANGVLITGAGYVSIIDCKIIGFNIGIDAQASPLLYVGHTLVTNSTYGILLAGAQGKNEVNDTQIVNNTYGLQLRQGSLILRRSVLANNRTFGLETVPNGTTVQILDSMLGLVNAGTASISGTASMRVSNRGILHTYGNNYFSGVLGNPLTPANPPLQ